MQPHIFKGKDRPAQLGPKLHSDIERTIGLMFLICEPIFYMGKTFVMDNDLCSANGIVALAEKIVYAGALIKHRRFRAKSV